MKIKKCLNGSQIGDREKVLLFEERKVIWKAKFSSSITSGDKNRAWQEIANIEKEKRNLEKEKLKLEKKTKHGKE